MPSSVLRSIADTSVRLRFLVIVIAVILVTVALEVLPEMPIDIWPEFNPPAVEIQTEALGLPAAEVESLITVPMEADLLNGVAWLDHMYSQSVAGLSSILLIFEPGTDPIAARQMVQERLTQAFALPNVSKPPTMLQPLSSMSRVMTIGLSSHELSLIDLSVLARWNIKPRLMGVPGVANVAIWGQRERQLQVQVDPARLQTQGVTLQQVIETTGNSLWVSPLSFLNASSPGTAGWIDTPNQRLGLHHILPITGPADLARVAVVGNNQLRLGDVAAVVEDHQPLIGDATLPDGPGLLLVIEKFPGTNTLEVTEEVEEALAAMRPGLAGIDIDTTIFRPATYIELAQRNLAAAVVLAAVLAVLVLVAFLNEWRPVFISVAAVLVTLACAGLVIYWRGGTMNALVVAGVAATLGVIFDDVIGDVENSGRRRRQYPIAHEQSALSTVRASVVERRYPLMFATMIMLLVVVPILLIPDLARAFFSPAVISYGLALLASLLIALTVTPALTFSLARPLPSPGPSPLIRWLVARYQRLLDRFLRFPRVALSAMTAVIIAGALSLVFLTVSLTPPLRPTDVLVQWQGIPGTSLPAMNRIALAASHELRGIPGVRNVGSQVGRAVTGDQVVGINSGELWLNLDPAASNNTTFQRVREVIDGYPGIGQLLTSYQPERLASVLMGETTDLVVRIFGHDLDVLEKEAANVAERLATIDGITDAHALLEPREPQVEIEVDLDSAQRYQIKPGDIRRQATTLLSGLQVGNLFEEQKVFDVVVWGVPALRHSLTALQELLIDTPRGPVRLADVARLRIAASPTTIKHDTVSRYVDVVAQRRGRTVGAVDREVKQMLAGLTFPLEYHAELLAGSRERHAAGQRTLGSIVAVVISIFLLLQAAVDSARIAALVLLSVPVALVGGLLAVAAGPGILSLGSLFGFLAVGGIAVRHNLVLVKHWQQLEKSLGQASGQALILRGTQDRFTPIIMTTVAMGLATLPVLLVGPLPGYELLHPMAIVTLGGLVTSTLLTLFGLPAMYLRFNQAAQ